MDKRRLLRYGVVALVSTAGCVRTEPGPGVVIVFDGEITASTDGFSMTGTVVISGGVSTVGKYEETEITLYSDQGRQIHTELLGVLESDQSVTIRTDRVPQYVILSSPDFWREPEIQVEYYVLTDDEYRVEYATSHKELPIISQPESRSHRRGRTNT